MGLLDLLRKLKKNDKKADTQHHNLVESFMRSHSHLFCRSRFADYGFLVCNTRGSFRFFRRNDSPPVESAVADGQGTRLSRR